MTRLDGKVALVTGAARRTGKALAHGLGARGAHVAVHYHTSRGEAERTAAELEPAGMAVAADLTDSAAAERMVTEVLQRWGRLDILVNNVGTFQIKPLNQVGITEWRAAIETTVTATFIVCQAVLPHMVERNYGRIINLADSGADKINAQPTLTPYMIGKTGVLILTRSLAAIHASRDITVNAVSPGILENSITKPPSGQHAIPKGRYATYADLINAVLFFLDDASSYVTGENLKVAGGWQL